MELNNYDLIIINSSAGKDSLCAIWEIAKMAKAQNYPASKIVVSHQCLGRMEWNGTKELAARQAAAFGFKIYFSSYRSKAGESLSLLGYARRRKMWPDSGSRWCTSEFKRGPGQRVITELTKDLGECKVLHVYGFRAQESPNRKKKKVFQLNDRASTKKRKVWDYLPIHHWSVDTVWEVIKREKLEYHPAYDLGMPRLSCVFCIFSPKNALIVAGKANPGLLAEYVATEKEIGHRFRKNLSLEEVQQEIEDGAVVNQVEDWEM